MTGARPCCSPRQGSATTQTLGGGRPWSSSARPCRWPAVGHARTPAPCHRNPPRRTPSP
ncbi:hypothetical protein HaLaN_16010, partial [Haematococcus lacustris]